jgi:hypothetical protein
MEPCRRNPQGAGGLRRQTASELLPDVHDIAFVALPGLASARPLRAAAPPLFNSPLGSGPRRFRAGPSFLRLSPPVRSPVERGPEAGLYSRARKGVRPLFFVWEGSGTGYSRSAFHPVRRAGRQQV